MNIQCKKFKIFNMYQLKPIPFNPSPPNLYFPLTPLPPHHQKITLGTQMPYSSNTVKKCHPNLSSYCGNTLEIQFYFFVFEMLLFTRSAP